MSSSSGADTWNLISSVIGVLALPFIWAYARSQHPETKLAELDSTLKDTETILRSVVEEGLIDSRRQVPHFESRLAMFRTGAEKFREETILASIRWTKLFKAWLDGLSREISVLCAEVKEVRVDICETSAKARRQLTQEGPQDASCPPSKWRVQIVSMWQRIVSFVCRKASSQLPDDTPPTTSPAPAQTAVVSVESTTCACHEHGNSPPPPPKVSRAARRPKPNRTSSLMSNTAPLRHKLQALVRTIHRVDRELTAQGVTNTHLTQFVQAMQKQWSPASSKAYRPRRSRKRRSLVARVDVPGC